MSEDTGFGDKDPDDAVDDEDEDSPSAEPTDDDE